MIITEIISSGGGDYIIWRVAYSAKPLMGFFLPKKLPENFKALCYINDHSISKLRNKSVNKHLHIKKIIM